MSYFFVDKKHIAKDSFEIAGQEARHIAKVLRKKPGDRIKFFDGEDHSYLGEITEIRGDCIRGKLIEMETDTDSARPYFRGAQVQSGGPEFQKPRSRMRLFQSLPRASKFDWIVEKATELGADEIIPVISERVIVRLDKSDFPKKIERWNKVAIAACKQCGRSRPPKISEPVSFEKAIPMACGVPGDRAVGLTIIPWEGESEHDMKSALAGMVLGKPGKAGKNPQFGRDSVADGISAVNLFIGPEGGYTPDEIALARKSGAQVVSLGPRILRVETAAIACLAIVQNHLEH